MNKEIESYDFTGHKMGIDTNNLKTEINNLIWMYAPDNLTLKEAEERAIKVFDIILNSMGT